MEVTMKKKIFQYLSEVLVEMSEEELLKLVEIPPENKMGDYAIPCFAMAKKMHRNPMQIASELVEKLNEQKSTLGIEKAENVRKHWKLGEKPIDNLVYIVESHGLVVTDFDTNTGDVDAYSHKISCDGTETYLIGYSKNKNAAARIHFDLAHELGHILLHDWNEDLSDISKEEFKELENQANDFAASFLMPENEFKADIGNYANKLPYYVELKKRWKVSIAAMIRRSYSLGLIGNDEYQRMMRNMQKQGIRKVEPLDDILVTARPSLLKQAVGILLNQNVFTPREFMDELSSEYGLTLNAEDLEKLLGLSKGTLMGNLTLPQMKVILKK